MKIAIRPNTKFDLDNVIPFFEKHFPNCNSAIDIRVPNKRTTYAIVDNDWVGAFDHNDPLLKDYTILDGVPLDMELPKLDNPVLGLNSCLANQKNLDFDMVKILDDMLEPKENEMPENLELPKSALVELQNEYQNKYQGIFNLLSKEHNLTLLVTEMDEIIREVNKISSREQLLEECLRDLCYELTGEQESEDELEKGLGIRLASLVHQAKKLLENKS